MPLHDKAFYVTLAFVVGVGTAGFDLGIWWALIGALLLARLVFPLKTMAAITFALGVFLGFFYLNLYLNLNEDNIPFGTATAYQGEIISEPEVGIKTTELEVELAEPYKGTVRIYTRPGITYHYGDTVTFTDAVELSTSGRLNIVSFPGNLHVVASGGGNPVKRALIGFKEKLVANLNRALPARLSALAAGVLLGERAEFTDEFEEAMRQSGTTHIVALSGYNIAILAIVLSSVLAYIWNRKMAFYLSLAVIPAFVVMTGAEASVVRAGIMGLILLLAEHRERVYNFRNAITITAGVMLLYNPTLISQDVAFQLSFAALLGIVYIYPWLAGKLRSDDDGFLSWKRNLLQTASAQVAVLPIILGTFGFFSPTALISNVLILEFIPITMFLSFITAIAGFLSFNVSLVVGWLASIFLGYEVFIINLFGFTGA